MCVCVKGERLPVSIWVCRCVCGCVGAIQRRVFPDSRWLITYRWIIEHTRRDEFLSWAQTIIPRCHSCTHTHTHTHTRARPYTQAEWGSLKGRFVRCRPFRLNCFHFVVSTCSSLPSRSLLPHGYARLYTKGWQAFKWREMWTQVCCCMLREARAGGQTV